MTHPESLVEKHYTRDSLYETIIQRLHENGITNITRKDIGGIDEFHVRGAAVSIELAKEAGLDKNLNVLDVGCGLGGPARMLAEEYGCHVTGIDITKSFIDAATSLSKLVGLEQLNSFTVGDALNLPFEDNSFDIVWTQHVQMNIENKNKFYSEIARVLKSGGRFLYYDIFRKDDRQAAYPLPWAESESISFLTTTTRLHQLLLELGLTQIKLRDQTSEALEFFRNTAEKNAKEGPPKLGLNLVMGTTSGEKLGNLMKNVKDGLFEIQSGIYKK